MTPFTSDRTVTEALAQLPARISRRIEVDQKSGCWLWTGSKTTAGYGQVWWNGKMRFIHRVVYEVLVGEIPRDLTLDHVKTRGCVNRHCCNPAHLEPVEGRENTLRGEGPSAANAAKTHCIHGHEFTAENTRFTGPNRDRKCRTCDNRRSKEKLRRMAAEAGRPVISQAPKIKDRSELKIDLPRDLHALARQCAAEEGITIKEWVWRAMAAAAESHKKDAERSAA